MDPNINLYDELPTFANKENREKQKQIRAKQKELDMLNLDCDEYRDRLKIIVEHKKSVEEEIGSAQQILNARVSEVETEKHLEQLAIRESSKIKQQLTQIEEESSKIETLASQIQSKIFTGQRRIEQFKNELKMNQQQLEQWVQASRDKEEDYLILQRYQKSDEGKIREMILQMEQETSLIDSKKAELDAEVTTTRALQIELNMTADQFKKLHEDRAQLLSQWENTLATMQALNDQIESTTDSFEKRKEDASKLRADVLEVKKNLEDAQAKNADYERQITLSDRNIAKNTEKLTAARKELDETKETVETQRHNLEKLEGDMRAYQAEIDDLRNKTARESAKRQALLERKQATDEAFSMQKDSTDEMSAQQNALNGFLASEQAHLKHMDMAIEAEKATQFKMSQEVYAARKEEKNLLAEIESSRARAKNLGVKITDMDRETQKQIELLYNSNYHVQMMQKKIARVQGERTEEEKADLQMQIDNLTRVLNAREGKERMVQHQVSQLELDLRQGTKNKDRLEAKRTELETRLNEIDIDQKAIDSSAAKVKKKKEEHLVQLNLLRIKVENLTNAVNVKADEAVALENRKEQLRISLDERIEEINAHMAALRVQLKTEEEARHDAILELAERKRRESTLADKYQVDMGRYRVDGEEVSQSYRVIKFAQEREEIVAEGDELEAEIKKALKELKGLETAASKLNIQTHSLKSGMQSLPDGDAMVENRKALEERKSQVQHALRTRKSEVRQAEDERRAMEQTYQQLHGKIKAAESEIRELKSYLTKAQSDTKLLEDKLGRARTALRTAQTQQRKETNTPLDRPYPATLREMDVEVKMAKSVLDEAVDELSRLANLNSEIAPPLNIGLAQLNLQLKKTTPVPSRGQTAASGSRKSPIIMTPVTSMRGSSSGSARSIATAGSASSRTSSGTNVSVISFGGGSNFGTPGPTTPPNRRAPRKFPPRSIPH